MSSCFGSLGHIIIIPSPPVVVSSFQCCKAEKQQIPMLVFALTQPWIEHTVLRNERQRRKQLYHIGSLGINRGKSKDYISHGRIQRGVVYIFL